MQRLLIIADNSFAAQSIRLALRQTAGFQVVGFIDATQPIGERIAEVNAEVILLDDTREPEQIVSRLQELVIHAPEAKRILLTMRMDDESVNAVLDAGADAIISKTVHRVSLGTLLREVTRGAVIQRPRPATKSAAVASCPLTERELEILRLVAQGYTNARIARELWVTEQTVKFHLSNTYRKLGVANRTEASNYAHQNALLAA